MSIEKEWTTVVEAKDVTKEILEIAESVVDGWYSDSEKRIDWEDFLFRMEKVPLSDGTRLDFGSDATSPAITKVQRWVRKYRELEC